ncbi:immunoglobulin superfamily member 5 isoform X3 [Dermochelys coriacea]|uniref:immunoglobulin superfamily member 5 isoform X3 n=1 Tax=Dermochelys coriacea TaxID=27794 RepID=UPI001CA92245|nr:immunoglobulin superfamily member 5 isoform X3 [Dermochelys coriacea]
MLSLISSFLNRVSGENVPMDSLQKFIPVTFILFASVTGFGFDYSIINGPANATVLAGSEARFNCTVSQGWQVIIWLLNGNAVLTTTPAGGAVVTMDRFTQQNYTSGETFTSELIIHNVQLDDSGQIECSIQLSITNSYAFLSVQVNGSLLIKDHNSTVRKNETIDIVCEALGWAPAPNMTWMINDSFVDKSRYVTNHSQGSNDLHNEVSTLTLTPMANETLTCLAYIEALPKPQNATVTLIVQDSLAESTYQKELRKVSTKKTNDGSMKTRRSSGNENSGYSPEDPVYTKQMPRIAPLPPMASSLYRPEQDLEVNSTSEISTHVGWQSSQVPRSSRSLPYHTSISPVHHQNHHRQQPKTQNYKRQQIRTPHLRIIYPRTLQSRSRHPHIRTLYHHKYQHRHQHPHTRTLHPKTQQPKGQHLQTNQQLRSQHPQPRIHQPQGQQIKNQHLRTRTQQFWGQEPQSKNQKCTGQNPQLVTQKPKDPHL